MNTIFKRYFMTGLLAVSVASGLMGLERGSETSCSTSAVLIPDKRIIVKLENDLAMAMQLNDTASLQALLKSAAVDINRRFVYANGGHTLLTWAASLGRQGIVQWLIKNGAEKDLPDAHNLTPLFVAVKKRNFGLATFLHELGCSVRVNDGGSKRTPLHFAVLGDSVENVALLISWGADVNAQDYCGNTILDWALTSKDAWNRADVVRLLLGRGAQASQRTLDLDISIFKPELRDVVLDLKNMKKYWGPLRDAWAGAVVRSIIRGPRVTLPVPSEPAGASEPEGPSKPADPSYVAPQD
ncbi:MAG: ankyrin repeat domain-containing protein [bacterium]